MKGTLLRSDGGLWYVRRVTASKDVPTLDVIDKFPLHPSDKINPEGFISKDIEFEIIEMLNFISEGDEPARQKSIKYAKLIK